MRKRLLSVALAIVACSSVATARQSTLSMTCAQAAALVASQGAVVLTTGPHTFERFVAHGGYCMLGEYAAPGRAPTLDSPSCPLGLVCKDRPRLFEDDHFMGGGIFGR